MYSAAAVWVTGGTWQIAPMQPSAGDHSYLDFELYLVFRSVTTILAAIAAAVCLKGVHAEGKSEYLKYLVRALVVLVVVEVFFDIVQWFGTYDYCEDTQMQNAMRQYTHCMPHTQASAAMGFDPSSSPLECEERMAKFDLPQTLLGVALNTCAPAAPLLADPHMLKWLRTAGRYFVWIVSSFEKSTRETGAQELVAPSQPV